VRRPHTMATLLLELALTRIFSVVFYYHFAFLAISIALFGWARRRLSYVVAGWKAPLFARLGRSAPSTASSCFWRWGDSGAEITLELDLALIYFTTALPFFLSGRCLLPSPRPSSASTGYFATC